MAKNHLWTIVGLDKSCFDDANIQVPTKKVLESISSNIGFIIDEACFESGLGITEMIEREIKIYIASLKKGKNAYIDNRDDFIIPD